MRGLFYQFVLSWRLAQPLLHLVLSTFGINDFYLLIGINVNESI